MGLARYQTLDIFLAADHYWRRATGGEAWFACLKPWFVMHAYLRSRVMPLQPTTFDQTEVIVQ